MHDDELEQLMTTIRRCIPSMRLVGWVLVVRSGLGCLATGSDEARPAGGDDTWRAALFLSGVVLLGSAAIRDAIAKGSGRDGPTT
jgi:hypothetical protein